MIIVNFIAVIYAIKSILLKTLERWIVRRFYKAFEMSSVHERVFYQPIVNI